ncbi:MAG TPA: LCP family protein [Anaerolineales bacterium]|nr:LCP family protein [Anaerolineales bacterium]
MALSFFLSRASRRWLAALLAAAAIAAGVSACAPSDPPADPPVLTAQLSPTALGRPPEALETATPAPPEGSETDTRAHTPAPTGTATPTAQAVVAPTLGYYNITPAADATLVTPIPTPVNPIQLNADLVNILLIGTDYRAAENGYRTDTLIIVSINTSTGFVTMLSIPRDLYVYVPTWGMSRINKAYHDGEKSHYAGEGPGLLKQTVLYNLGIPIHYYALANFAGFRQIVDTVGGIEVPVNCQLTEYKIKDWSLDEADPNSYELYTQPMGVTHMDGALALWYARARPVGGDFFRSYRQRQVLRALYHKGMRTNLIANIPELYGDFNDVVQTDMGLWDIMQFAPLTTKFDDAQIRSLHIGPNQTTPWVTPRGEDVLLPKPDAIQALVTEALTAPSGNQLLRALTPVEIWNGTTNADWDELAAETLANEGFAPIIGQADGNAYATTTIIDFTTSPKGSPIQKLQAYLHVEDPQVITQPDSNNPTPFRVILGSDYNPCPRLDWMDNSSTTATPTP